MRKGTVLPIALMAFAIVAFLFVVTYAVTPGLKFPWSTKSTETTYVPVAVTSQNTNTLTILNNNTNTAANTNTAIEPTANWKTYTSKQYGLTFKYPTDWVVEEGLLNSPYSVRTHPKTSPDTPTLIFWLDSAYDGMQTPSGAKSKNINVTYAGRPAILSKTTTSAGELLIAHIQFVTTPIGWGESSTISLFPNDAGSIDLPLQIMGTLSIADPTADWKTYTNTTWDFSFRYPKEWSVVTNNLQPKGEYSMPGQNVTIGVEYGTRQEVRPGMQFWIDPTGWGGRSSDTIYAVKKSGSSFAIVKSERTGAQVGEFGLGEYYTVKANQPDVTIGRFYIDFFSDVKGRSSASFDTTVEAILTSFTFGE